MDLSIVDGYLHCGLRKYQPFEVVSETLNSCGVHRAVLVQHMGEFDNAYLQKAVASAPQRFAGVCLVDTTDPQCLEKLGLWHRTGCFQGLRIYVDALRSNEDLCRRAHELGMRIVVYDDQPLLRKINLIEDFLARHPQATLVLSHLARPDMNSLPDFLDHQQVLDLGRYPNVFYQLSGMHMISEYPYRELWDFIRRSLAAFGPQRVYWGSNFPVVGDREAYRRELEFIKDVFPVPESARPWLLGGTALKLWWG